MAIIRTAWSSKSQGDAATFVGRKGEIFWDNDSAELRYSDGVTPGGIPIVAAGGGGGGVTIQITGYVNTAANLQDPYTGNTGDTFLARDTGNLYIWDGANWIDLGVVLGPRGYSGSKGFTGSMGFVGYTGSTGLGFVGSQGSIGPIGYTGSPGTGGGGGGSLNSITDSVTTVTNVLSLRFDNATGLLVTDLGSGVAQVSINSGLLNPDSFKNIQVSGQNTITASGADTIRFVAGTGINITTDDTASPKSITFNSSNTAPIKTFNILNEFSAPLIGTAVFAPNSTDVIRSVQLTNGRAVGSDLMVGLYRNQVLLSFFTLPSGYVTYAYQNLNFLINNNDYLTVNVVQGRGINFSLALFNI